MSGHTVQIDLRIATVDDLLERLARGRDHSDGEAVDLLAHGLQCAALLASAAPHDVELQVAGLVHDVGTLLEPNRPARHARTGGAAVEPLLGPRVAALVAAHDDAKRYLVAVEARYAESLSARSLVTLGAQGGRMATAECAAFGRRPDLADLVALRRADDAAKVPGVLVPDLEEWAAALWAVARADEPSRTRARR